MYNIKTSFVAVKAVFGRFLAFIFRNVLSFFKLEYENGLLKISADTKKLAYCPVCVRSNAFTLAEVLVVIGVIGVISALVLPNLIASNDERVMVTRIKKLNATFNEAQKRAEAVYGPINNWFVRDSNQTDYNNRYGERIIEFLKVGKNCQMVAGQGCFTNTTVKYLNNTSFNNIDTWAITLYRVVLATGESVAFYIGSNMPNGSDNSGGTLNSPFINTLGQIYVDIDGVNKGANTLGFDIFQFSITTTGVYPYASRLHVIGKDDAALKTNCFDKGFCTGWVVETGNVDYLIADRTGKCPNGKQLGWNSKSCK